jgi:ribosomal protein L11 methyltransferase
MVSTLPLWQFNITCPPVTASYLQELLWTLPTMESVTELYRPNAETDQITRADVSGVSVMLTGDDAESQIQALLLANPKLSKVCQLLEGRTIEDADWVDHWKKHWHPTRVTSKLVICPTWEDYTPENIDERIIRLDPEIAFGTGTHETTRLMLETLEKVSQERDLSQCSLLDLGTGSGILAIDAALLGCRDIRGIDNDSRAVETARKNAKINGVESYIDFTDTPLAETCQTRYDIVLVNIIAPVILELWDDIIVRMKPDSLMIASGLIERSVGDIQAKMEAAGFTDIKTHRQNDWFALQGQYAG